MNIFDNDVFNFDKFFWGNLSLHSGFRDSIIVSSDRARATILDNEIVIIGFVDNFQVIESVHLNVSIPIHVLEGQLGRSVMVRVFTRNGSAEGRSM